VVYTLPISSIQDKNVTNTLVAEEERAKFQEWQVSIEATNIATVQLLVNPSREIVASVTAKAQIFLHIGVGNHHSHSLLTQPASEDVQSFETVGLAVLEAMSAGCVPLVIGKDGGEQLVNGHNALIVSKSSGKMT
jgi:glycosyltransferase involved in cell wall biosynthesis